MYTSPHYYFKANVDKKLVDNPIPDLGSSASGSQEADDVNLR